MSEMTAELEMRLREKDAEIAEYRALLDAVTESGRAGFALRDAEIARLQAAEATWEGEMADVSLTLALARVEIARLRGALRSVVMHMESTPAIRRIILAAVVAYQPGDKT